MFDLNKSKLFYWSPFTLQDDRDNFLSLALEGYKRCLVIGDKYDVRVVCTYSSNSSVWLNWYMFCIIWLGKWITLKGLESCYMRINDTASELLCISFNYSMTHELKWSFHPSNASRMYSHLLYLLCGCYFFLLKISSSLFFSEFNFLRGSNICGFRCFD